MAFDADTGVVILFGGNGAHGPLNDTWGWDGVDWRQLNPATMPPAMPDPAMAAYPPNHELVVYFFSESWPGAPANNFWIWNGTNWSEGGSATAPVDLTEAPSRMSYLEATKTLYRLGRSAGRPVMLAFNGTAWTDQCCGFPSSIDFTLAPDQSGSQLVALSSGSGTFLWNGTSWGGWAGPTPTFRRGTATVYDSTRAEVVLFAGDVDGLDTWTWTSARGWGKPAA